MTREEIMEIRTKALGEFRNQLLSMGVKKANLELLSAGFEDGMSAMLRELREAGQIIIENKETF